LENKEKDKDKDKIKLLNKIGEGYKKAAAVYSENYEYQATVQNIPIIGPFIDQMIKETSSKIGQSRANELLALLIEAMNLIDQYKVDYPYLESEEFYDLISKVVEKSMRDRYKEKRILYVKILTNSILIENKHLHDNSEDFLSILDDLTPKDLVVLKNIYKQQKEMQPYYNPDDNEYDELKTVELAGWNELQSICNLSQVDFKISLLKLSRCGLLHEIVGMILSYRGEVYTITIKINEYSEGHVKFTLAILEVPISIFLISFAFVCVERKCNFQVPLYILSLFSLFCQIEDKMY
jgi:hypothetical protein